MVEFQGFELDFRFDYRGRNGWGHSAVLCCTQDRMSELVDTCLDELEQHWSSPRSSNLESWTVELMRAIIKGAGLGAIDSLGKYDSVFSIPIDTETVEELQAQSVDEED